MGMEWSWNGDGMELAKTQADRGIKTDLPGINIFIFSNAKLTRVQIFVRIKSNAKLTGGLKNFRAFKKTEVDHGSKKY